MTAATILGVVFLALATYLSALAMSIMLVSRSGLEARLETVRARRRADWFFDHDADVHLSVSLARSVARIAFLGAVLVEVVGLGEGATLTLANLFTAGGIMVGLVWLCTSVLAAALARHAGDALVAGGLPLLHALTMICTPVVRAFGFIDEAVRRLTGANLRELDGEAELLRSIGDTHREGGLDEKSAALLENVVEFSTTDVGEVMTPRTDIDGIELTDDLADIRAFIVSVGHSRIPVYEENLDHIVGVLYVKDLVPYLGEAADDFELRPVLRQPIRVPETKQVRELLGDFQRSEVHLAIVIDEYGGTAGLVTIEDVLEEIVGEIHDEHDAGEDELPTFEAIDARRAEVDGRYHIDDLNERLGLTLPEDEEFDTVAGYVLARLGRVPEVGETFEIENARFTMLAATPTHVKRVGIELLAPTGANVHSVSDGE